MRKRKLRWALAGLVILAGAVTFLAWLRPMSPAPVTLENYRRIKAGMSRAETEAILGGPPGDYSTGPTNSIHEHMMSTQVMANDGRPVWDDYVSGEWRSDAQSVYVIFDGSRTLSVQAFPNQLIEQDWIENLLWRVRRQWHKRRG
jgi:hypothetical protein